MRINKYVASATGMGRRASDSAIAAGRIEVNGEVPSAGYDVRQGDTVTLVSRVITPAVKSLTILLNKPVGYVCSRAGQGSKTVYDLLPPELHHLKPIGRLDKDSSGLLLLSTDGALAQELTHPSHQKQKIYEITLDKPLQPLHRQMISDRGITLDDGVSKFQLERLEEESEHKWRVTMHEGRNRQIRRTFAALGYEVRLLHRISIGPFTLQDTVVGEYRNI
jgi:23S rRNA pseudouridine2605 synthase